MAQTREPFNLSSPHSSGDGADSYKHEGTPDTRLTAFSPEDGVTRSARALKTITNFGPITAQTPVRFPVPPGNGSGFRASPSTTAEKDPFVTVPSITSGSAANKADSQLSPNAPAFRPETLPLIAHGSSPSVQLSATNGLDIQRPASQATVVLAADSMPSRYLRISSATQKLTDGDVDDYVTNLRANTQACRGHLTLCSPGNGEVHVHFMNIRDAMDTYGHILANKRDWMVTYTTAAEYARAKDHEIRSLNRADSHRESQIHLVAKVTVNPLEAEELVVKLLSAEGEILAFQRQPQSTLFEIHATVDFADMEIAYNVVKKYHGMVLGGVQLSLTMQSLPQLESSASLPSLGNIGSHAGSPAGFGHTSIFNRPVDGPGAMMNSFQPFNDLTNAFSSMSVARTPPNRGTMVPGGRFAQSGGGMQVYPQVSMYPMMFNTPISPQVGSGYQIVDQLQPRTPPSQLMGRLPLLTPSYTAPTVTGPLVVRNGFSGGRPVMPFSPRTDSRRQNAVRVNRSSYYNNASHHNHVDVNRIREGSDVRTTIMLRNIPNKVDQAMLKGIIDESSWGKYDFMYLRIDFANDCNVGYAFINFVDPLDIIDFVNARGNQRWNCFKSDKVAEISYATIQGKDCLVQKFRNSSVMLEAHHYRPMLLYTSNGPTPELAGKEEPFPEPDNHSKMKRSCENAEHVGLFTPNAGQHFRDEQRRRRSQYDRGTRLAALEEYDYENSLGHQAGYLTQH